MKKIELFAFFIMILISFQECYAQDSVSFSLNTCVVLDQFSSLFPNEKKAIAISSCFDENSNFYYKIHIIDKFSLAIKPAPLYYLKYKNLMLISQNYFYYVNHSADFLGKYLDDIKSYLDADIIVDSLVPLKYHLITTDNEFVVDEKIIYYYYKINNGKIISSESTLKPNLMPCVDNHSFE